MEGLQREREREQELARELERELELELEQERELELELERELELELEQERELERELELELEREHVTVRRFLIHRLLDLHEAIWRCMAWAFTLASWGDEQVLNEAFRSYFSRHGVGWAFGPETEFNELAKRSRL
jgi:hypothetical protein